MKGIVLFVLLATVCCSPLAAQDPYAVESYYSGNHWSPYPPGCVTVPLRQLDLYGDNVATIFNGTIELNVVQKDPSGNPARNLTPVPMKMFRLACAETNRSVILVEFNLAEERLDPRASQIELPDFVGSTAFHGFPFILKSEPNTYGLMVKQRSLSRITFGDYTGGWDNANRFTWRYILDVNPTGHFWGPWVSDYYNGSFGLEIELNKGFQSVMLVPSTQSVLSPNSQLPLNGRLSGNWIEHGTSDQGFLLSVSTPVSASEGDLRPEQADLLVFLAWYTFDSTGQMLWLTASATVPQGSSAVNLNFVQVENGQFMGDLVAQRSFVGSGKLRAKSCDQLELDFDLSALGLGTGQMELNRIFALEIAGYNCRDYQARLDSLYGQESR